MASDEEWHMDIKRLEAAWRLAYTLLETRLATLEQVDAEMRSRLAALEASRTANQQETRADLDALFAPEGRRNGDGKKDHGMQEDAGPITTPPTAWLHALVQTKESPVKRNNTIPHFGSHRAGAPAL